MTIRLPRLPTEDDPAEAAAIAFLNSDFPNPTLPPEMFNWDETASDADGTDNGHSNHSASPAQQPRHSEPPVLPPTEFEGYDLRFPVLGPAGEVQDFAQPVDNVETHEDWFDDFDVEENAIQAEDNEINQKFDTNPATLAHAIPDSHDVHDLLNTTAFPQYNPEHHTRALDQADHPGLYADYARNSIEYAPRTSQPIIVDRYSTHPAPRPSVPIATNRHTYPQVTRIVSVQEIRYPHFAHFYPRREAIREELMEREDRLRTRVRDCDVEGWYPSLYDIDTLMCTTPICWERHEQGSEMHHRWLQIASSDVRTKEDALIVDSMRKEYLNLARARGYLV